MVWVYQIALTFIESLQPDQKLYKYATHNMEQLVNRYQNTVTAEETVTNDNYCGVIGLRKSNIRAVPRMFAYSMGGLR